MKDIFEKVAKRKIAASAVSTENMRLPEDEDCSLKIQKISFMYSTVA